MRTREETVKLGGGGKKYRVQRKCTWGEEDGRNEGGGGEHKEEEGLKGAN